MIRVLVALWLMSAACFIKPDPQGGNSLDANFAFVTSEPVIPSQLGGLAGGDATCNTAATEAGLAGNYTAWLATPTEPVTSRVHGRGWMRIDGHPFADQLADILAGRTYYPLRITEQHSDVGTITSKVATSMTDDGTPRSSCLDGMDPNIVVGLADAGGIGWSAASDDDCALPVRLYCFGTDLDVMVPQPATMGARLAFVTESAYPMSTVADADGYCNTEAGATDRFQAFVATSTASARSRFVMGAPWARPDGVVVTEDLVKFGAPITLSFHSILVDSRVWTGSKSTLDPSGNSDESCGDWTDPSQNAIVGASARSSDSLFVDTTGALCTSVYRFYCFEK